VRLTIVGLGLIGTSLGLALKEATGDIAITGHDPDDERVSRARKLGAIDKSHWNLPAACDDADLIVLDIPFDELETTLRALGEGLKSGAVVLDITPLKETALRLARELLPEDLDVIGLHPVFPGIGPRAAEPSAELLQGTPCYLVVPEGASAHAVEAATDLVAAVGTEARFIGALEHDGLVAATDQLPRMAAAALINVTHSGPGHRDRTHYVGRTLLASVAAMEGAEGHSPDALFANRKNLLPWIDAYIRELQRGRALLAAGNTPELTALLKDAAQAAEEWLTGESPNAERDAGSEHRRPWGDLFIGGWRRRG